MTWLRNAHVTLVLDPCEETLTPLATPFMRTLGGDLVPTLWHTSPLGVTLRGILEDGPTAVALVTLLEKGVGQPLEVGLTTRWAGKALTMILTEWKLTTEGLEQAMRYEVQLETTGGV